ncbi:MAG: AmmeMemoRadiSam system protein A [bacterium]
MSSSQVELARKAIESYIKEGKKISPPQELPAELKEAAGVFVSLHKAHQLRGCIGTFLPTKANVAEEIISNAIESSTRDPRFPPVKKEELSELEISVDVLTAPAPVSNIDELDPKKYGIIVHSGGRRGLLLPDLEGVDTPERQIAICRQKAWIGEDEPIDIQKFRVRRFH